MKTNNWKATYGALLFDGKGKKIGEKKFKSLMDMTDFLYQHNYKADTGEVSSRSRLVDECILKSSPPGGRVLEFNR